MSKTVYDKYSNHRYCCQKKDNNS